MAEGLGKVPVASFKISDETASQLRQPMEQSEHVARQQVSCQAGSVFVEWMHGSVGLKFRKDGVSASKGSRVVTTKATYPKTMTAQTLQRAIDLAQFSYKIAM